MKKDNEDRTKQKTNDAGVRFALAFGPVPSRRLGRSIGVNVVPFKACTFSCIYCQLGPTNVLRMRRKKYFDSFDVSQEVKDVLRKAEDEVDAVTVLGEGEPTLASNLGEICQELRAVWPGRIALISNGSLFWKRSVREDARGFDVVSVNVSTGNEHTFSKLHRPEGGLTLDLIMEGLKKFSDLWG